MRKMFVFLALLFLYTGSSVAKKQDNSSFTACLTNNKTIRLNCRYLFCEGSTTPYTCEFMDSDGTLLAKRSAPNCSHEVPQNCTHPPSYSCKLTWKGRVHEKQIVVDISAKGPKKIPACPATTGLQLHRAPSFLLPVVSLTLWRILASDSQTT